MSTRTEFVELVDEGTGATFARVPVQITEVPQGEEQPAGFYFFFMPEVTLADIGTKMKVVLHGPFDTDEEAVLAGSDFALKAAEQRAKIIVGEAA
ncbi:hypothetical protein [Methylobacterium sp. AMS5]|uniref:hypothetical protein n=1 Tax=Methylobacterium sp. AMS5 TaxID=925818 RepID=UPI00074F90F7|nr:hypothetical protein [Methylobacterium sp. AMS5]AMB48346.1 hypothetical protein Y590_25595 [Methylobacterium sp. AMS5]